MYLDIGLLVLIAIFGLIGFVKGLMSQVIQLISFAGALIGTFYCNDFVATKIYGFITYIFPNFSLNAIVITFSSWIIIMVIFYFTLASLLEFFKSKLVKSISIKITDRILGLLCGVAYGLILSLLVVLALSWSKVLVEKKAAPISFERYQEWVDSSMVYCAGTSFFGVMQEKWPETKRIIPEEMQLASPVDEI